MPGSSTLFPRLAKSREETRSNQRLGATIVWRPTRSSKSHLFEAGTTPLTFFYDSLHFVEAPRPTTIRAGLEDLPERIDLSVVTDIVSAQTVAQAGQKRASPLSPTSQKYPPLPPAVAKAMSTTFSLHTANGVLAELQAVDAETYSEWIDG